MKTKRLTKKPDPLAVIGTTQADNRSWWEKNPMTYEGWTESHGIPHTEDEKEYYQEIDKRFFKASGHFSHQPGQPPFSALIDFANLQGKRVLEIGCGMGSHAELLSRSGAQFTGIDLTETAVRRTQKRFGLMGLHGTILQMDASKMTFPDNSFDFIWSWGVIHHAEDTEAIVREIYRVLTPGGKAQIMVYHKNSLRYYLYGGLREGIFHCKLPHMSLYEVNKSFTDGAIARHYSKKDVSKMLSKFRMVRTRVFDGGQEAYIPMIGKYLRKVFPSSMKKIDRWLLSRFGWFLFIEVMK